MHKTERTIESPTNIMVLFYSNRVTLKFMIPEYYLALEAIGELLSSLAGRIRSSVTLKSLCAKSKIFKMMKQLKKNDLATDIVPFWRRKIDAGN